MKDSSIVDIYSTTANMYGCEPCPQCGGIYRAVFMEKPNTIQCDHCGFHEMVTLKSIEDEE